MIVHGRCWHLQNQVVILRGVFEVKFTKYRTSARGNPGELGEYSRLWTGVYIISNLEPCILKAYLRNYVWRSIVEMFCSTVEIICLDQLLKLSAETNCWDYLMRSAVEVICCDRSLKYLFNLSVEISCSLLNCWDCLFTSAVEIICWDQLLRQYVEIRTDAGLCAKPIDKTSHTASETKRKYPNATTTKIRRLFCICWAIFIGNMFEG